MYRFVLSRRWLGFALFVALLAALCVRLGFWQLDRLHQRIDENRIVRQNMADAPVSAQSVQQLPDGDRDKEEWQRVRATGTYDTDHQVEVKYQTRDGHPGVDIVTPLVTDSGRALLVDRGWMKSDNNSDTVEDIPEPPTGTVTVVGWWHPSSQADPDAVRPVNGQVRAISSEGVASGVDYPLFHGYVNLRSQEPSGGALEPEPQPDLGNGPHFFYAMQWYFFAALAIVGWFYLAWAEAHPERKKARARARPSRPPQRVSTGPPSRT